MPTRSRKPPRGTALLACVLVCTGLSLLSLPDAAHAQNPYDPAVRQAAQRQALSALAGFEGEWRGSARTLLPSGQWLELTQTERFGPMLDGTLRVVEGRGYDAAGQLRFNAFGSISWRPHTQSYGFYSYAMGFEGDHPFEVRPDGFVWSTAAGPNARIRYTATLKDGVWTEIGERLVEGQEPRKVYEMTVRRIGPSSWPAGGAVAPQ